MNTQAKSNERPNHITASQLESIALCPGRWRLSQQIQSQPQSEDAAHGERVHKLLELKAREGGFTFDQATQQERDDALACWTLLEKLLSDIKASKVEYLCIEKRLFSNDKKWSGKPDLVILVDGLLTIIDYKTGRLDVTPSPRNTQLQALAVLAARQFNKNRALVAIIAPHGSEKVSVAEMDEHALDAAEKWIEHVVNAAMKPDAPLRPGDPQCRYCPAKGICPELAKWAIEPATKRVPILEKKLEKDQVRELSMAMPIEQAAEIWSRKQAVQWVYDAIEERLQALSDEQLAALGLERVPGRVIRSVKDVKELFARLKTQFGMDAATFTSMCDVKMTPLEEWLANAASIPKAQAKRLLAQQLEGICEEKQTKPTIREKKQ